MAYVALSRVRSIHGLYLTAFDASSIIVSTASLEEANRLCSLHRSDLPCYEIPQTKSRVKRSFSYVLDEGIDIPKAKKTKLSMNVERIAGKKKGEKESRKRKC